MTTETMYDPSEGLDPHPIDPYTWTELLALLDHHDITTGARELMDGRVVPADWDPNDPNPEVYALVADED